MEHCLQFLRHGDTVQFSGSNEVDQLPLLVRGGEGAEEEHDDHGQAENISPVIVFLARGLFGRTEQLGPHRFTELLLFLPRLAPSSLLLD